MKRIILVFLLVLVYSGSIAQYKKMPLDTSHYWQQQYNSGAMFPNPPYTCYTTLKVLKDSVRNSKTYKFIKATPYCGSTYFGLIREDTVLKRVIILDNNQEKILYNFNKNVGDTAMLTDELWSPQTYTLQLKDSVLINDSLYHKRYRYACSGCNATGFNVTVIEGVGSTFGLLSPWIPFRKWI